MEKQIKELRISIDGISQLVKELKPCTYVTSCDGQRDYNTPEIEKCYDSLIMGKGWLGIILAELGTVNPYKSGYKTKDDIEPTADISIIDLNSTVAMNHIEKVDWLRTEIGKLVSIIRNLNLTSENPVTRELAIARTNSFNHLCEAKFYLGFELQRIKEEK